MYINGGDIWLFNNYRKKQVLEVWTTKNVIKVKITGRVDIVRCIFEKTAKKLKLKSEDPKK